MCMAKQAYAASPILCLPVPCMVRVQRVQRRMREEQGKGCPLLSLGCCCWSRGPVLVERREGGKGKDRASHPDNTRRQDNQDTATTPLHSAHQCGSRARSASPAQPPCISRLFKWARACPSLPITCSTTRRTTTRYCQRRPGAWLHEQAYTSKRRKGARQMAPGRASVRQSFCGGSRQSFCGGSRAVLLCCCVRVPSHSVLNRAW